MIQLRIEVEGKTRHNIEIALDEAVKQIEKGYKEGFDSCDESNYRFFFESKD